MRFCAILETRNSKIKSSGVQEVMHAHTDIHKSMHKTCACMPLHPYTQNLCEHKVVEAEVREQRGHMLEIYKVQNTTEV